MATEGKSEIVIMGRALMNGSCGGNGWVPLWRTDGRWGTKYIGTVLYVYVSEFELGYLTWRTRTMVWDALLADAVGGKETGGE